MDKKDGNFDEYFQLYGFPKNTGTRTHRALLLLMNVPYKFIIHIQSAVTDKPLSGAQAFAGLYAP